MRIVFMGTPEFAVPSLEALLKSGDPVVGVVTQPDRPRAEGNGFLPRRSRSSLNANSFRCCSPQK
jgi:methionyl-tRNA formyltransferase